MLSCRGCAHQFGATTPNELANDAGALLAGGTHEAAAPKPAKRKAAFGTAVSSLLELLSAESSNAYSLRIISFLSRLPNWGIGAMKPLMQLGSAAAQRASIAASTETYRALGARCAESGVCMDLYVISHHYAGLSSLQSLSTLSGGALMLYEPVAKEGWANIPQDVFRELSRKRAVQGLLRMRTRSDRPPPLLAGLLLTITDHHDHLASQLTITDTSLMVQSGLSDRKGLWAPLCGR